MILLPTNKRIIRPCDKPSFEHTQRYGLIKGHWANTNRVGFWLFNEGSGGQVQDLSGNDYVGSISSGYTWVPGQSGPAIRGDNTNTHCITIPCAQNSPADLQGTGTIIAKIKPNSDAVSIVGRNDQMWLWCHSVDNKWATRVDSDTALLEVNNSVDWGQYQTIAFTYDDTSGDGYLYKNGVLIGSDLGNAENMVSSAANWYMGEDPRDGTGFPLSGDIDWVMIYNRVLSSSEIVQLYPEPFLGIEKRTAPIYFFVPTGGVVYQELNLTVSADASVLESDTQQMADTGKEVSADAAASESDTQQMVETGKTVQAAASVSCTDLKVVFELNLTVTATGSVIATDAHTMIETGKVVTAIASPAVIDTQAMVEIDLGVSAEGSVSCTDTTGLLAHIAAFMILRQCTT